MGTQCGAKSVFQQVATDFGGIQHVIATMKGHKIWWQVSDKEAKSARFFPLIPVCISFHVSIFLFY